MYTVINGTDKDARHAFLDVPRHVYVRDPHYVPEQQCEVCTQLDADRNPYFRSRQLQLFVCFRDSKPIARVSLVWPKDKSIQPTRAMFGYFECTDDLSAFGVLLDHIEATCADHGISVIEGPFSPCQYGITGIQVGGFGSRPAFLEPYSPPYYREFFGSSGFTVCQTGRTWRSTGSSVLHAAKGIDAGEVHGCTLRTVRSISTSEIQKIAAVMESAFRDNWGSAPISLEEYAHTARGLAIAFKPGLAAIVECDGKPIGAMIMLLDINEALHGVRQHCRLLTMLHLRRSRIRSLVVYAMGIVPESRNTRAALVLASEFRRVVAQFDLLTSTWITIGNRASEQLAERFGFQPTKTFEVYMKNL